MLSDSYVLEVMYSCGGEADCTVEAWFVKVPNCAKAYLLDEMEVFMYSNLLPLLQAFGSNACNVPSQLQLPIPLGENSIIFKEHQRNTNFCKPFLLRLPLDMHILKNYPLKSFQRYISDSSGKTITVTPHSTLDSQYQLYACLFQDDVEGSFVGELQIKERLVF